MTDLRDAAQQALEALQNCANGEDDVLLTRDALADLRAALEQPEQEPVARVVLTEILELPCLQWLDLDRQFDFKGGELLYTHPPCRETEQEPVADAMKTVIKAMQADPDYAWSWHCNVAMAFFDAGGDSYTANQGAARFMRLLANVDPAHELPPHPPRREWRGLTEEDMIDIQDRCGVTILRDEFIAIEAALKERNA